jgi:Tubulin like
MNEKLKRRKLDALKRGVHRMGGDDAAPVSTHVVGIGRAGCDAVTEMLRSLEPAAPKFSALVVDIGDHDLIELQDLAASLPQDRADVAIVSLEVLPREALADALKHYPTFLSLEYPRVGWGADYEPWLTPAVGLPAAGGHFRRAAAKAVYGLAYYAAARPMERALRAFAASIEAAKSQVVIAIVFGLSGGTGSGIAVDLARHLSCRIFGRRLLVAGVGIMPCGGDTAEHSGSALFSVLNELDCLGDEAKNEGIVAPCGELFRNPFTAGFIMVPQQPVWESTQDLALTHHRVDQEIATLLTGQGGINLWETLRLLNWVAAPSTQHSAARTPWGPKWIHMLAFADAAGKPIAVTPAMPASLGLLGGYAPEYIEIRVASGNEATTIAVDVAAAFLPDVAPQIVIGGRESSVQFILPCVSKTDLAQFYEARDAYDALEYEEKVLDHSLLLEQGVVLSEASTQLEGMAGASLWGRNWTAVSLSDLRGGDGPTLDAGGQHELRQLGYPA